MVLRPQGWEKNNCLRDRRRIIPKTDISQITILNEGECAYQRGKKGFTLKSKSGNLATI